MEWYWAVIIYSIGNITFIILMLTMYKFDEHCEKQKDKKKIK